MTKEEWAELGIFLDNVKRAHHSANILVHYNMNTYGPMCQYLNSVYTDAKAHYDSYTAIYMDDGVSYIPEPKKKVSTRR